MKKVIVLFVCILVAAGAVAQTVDLNRIELSDLDLMQADLSNAEFYFAGPVDLLVRGIRYMGLEYAALLEYDGRGNVAIAAPRSASAAGLPYALNLSEVQLSLVSDGIRVSNVIADGYYFSGKLLPTRTTALAVSPEIQIGGVAGTADLSEDVADLTGEIRRLRSRIAGLESERDDAVADLADTNSDLRTANSEVRTANSQLRTANRNLDAANSQIASLESQLRRAAQGTADPLEAVSRVTRSVKTGFSGGGAANGAWSLSGSRLRQTSATALYAKYPIAIRQNDNELVYTFGGRGAAEGWSGYGIHFLASGSDESNLYGYGNSYLAWVTRDPINTQSDYTYIQIYRSFDDTRMVQVASRAIPVSITSPFEVTVYVNRSEGRVVVGVGDEAVLDLEDPSIIRSGTHVVGRTLGPAELTNLSVRSR